MKKLNKKIKKLELITRTNVKEWTALSEENNKIYIKYANGYITYKEEGVKEKEIKISSILFQEINTNEMKEKLGLIETKEETQYICPVCNKPQVVKTNKKTSIRMNNEEIEEVSIYECTECRYATTNKSLIKRKKRICEKCGEEITKTEEIEDCESCDRRREERQKATTERIEERERIDQKIKEQNIRKYHNNEEKSCNDEERQVCNEGEQETCNEEDCDGCRHFY